MRPPKTTPFLISLALCALPTMVLAEQATPTAARPEGSNEGTAPKSATPATADKGWFEKMLAREMDLGPLREIKSADGYFRARVPAKVSSEPVETEGSHYVVLDADMGPDALVECWVFHDDKDLASSLAALSESTLALMSERHGKIEVKAIKEVHAGVVGSHPTLGLSWLYRVATEKGPLAGQVKQLIASKYGRALFCQHTAVGFSKTFRSVFEALVASVEYAAPNPVPHFSETQTLSIKGQRVGVSHTTHSLDEDGDVEIVERVAMMLPVDNQTLQTEDSVRVAFSGRDGSVISVLKVEVAGA